jgi:tetratricopeptide (TPR) repeat protein
VLDSAEGARLLHELDGLPLAIAQAGAYLQSRRIGIAKYLEYYNFRWNDIMKSRRRDGSSIEAYAGRSVATTWTISYEAIREEHTGAANLLLLWSMLDNKDLWYGMFAAACERSAEIVKELSQLIGSIATDEFDFHEAMDLLRSYSLIEDFEDVQSYTTHSVVHRWAYHYGARQIEPQLARAAILLVGWAIPTMVNRDNSMIQRRLLPHAQACSRLFSQVVAERSTEPRDNLTPYRETGKNKNNVLPALHMIGVLYADQGKLKEAEAMYIRVLQGKEEELGPNHTSTLATVSNLGLLYINQGKLEEAEVMCIRALQGYEEFGPKDTSILETVNNLGNLYNAQGKLREAEGMYMRALQGKEEALGPKHMSTLITVSNLASLCADEGRLKEAEVMYIRALQGYEEAFGPKHAWTLDTVNNLGLLYADQGKPDEAKAMFSWAMQGYEEALGPNHTSLQRTANNLRNFYHRRFFSSTSIVMLGNGTKHRKIQPCDRDSPAILHQITQLCIKFPSTQASSLGQLGRMLVWGADDDVAATIAFQYQYSLWKPNWSTTCDSCEKNVTPTLGRAVCKVCEDVDLCGVCYEKHLENEMLGTFEQCRDHAFLDLRNMTAESPSQSLEEWLSTLCTQIAGEYC